MTIAQVAWMAAKVQVPNVPKQFPILRPPGCCAVVSKYPRGHDEPSQSTLDEMWLGFCEGAEAELKSLLQIPEAEHKHYSGRG